MARTAVFFLMLASSEIKQSLGSPVSLYEEAPRTTQRSFTHRCVRGRGAGGCRASLRHRLKPQKELGDSLAPQLFL